MKALALGVAAGLLIAGGLAAPLLAGPAASKAAARERTFFETVVLMRWGYGALDWPPSESQRGDPHVPKRHRD